MAKLFVYSWTIENFSFCPDKLDTCFKSLPFTVENLENTKWYLCLYPKGYTGNGSVISCRLCRAKDDYGPKDVVVCVQRAFSTHRDSMISFYNEANVVFKPNTVGVHCTVAKVDVITDKFTVHCRLWKGGNLPFDTVSRSEVSKIQVQRYWFEWKVEYENGEWSVKSKKDHSERAIYIPNLSANLRQTEDDEDRVLDFIMTPGVGGVPEITRFRIHKVDAEGTSTLGEEIEVTKENLKNINEWHFSWELTWNDFFKRDDSQLQKHASTVRVELITSYGNLTTSVVKHPQGSECKVDGEFFKQMGSSMFTFWKEGTLTDVQLKTSTKTFLAHRLVLSSSSEVFENMFTTNMSGKSNDSIDVPDIRDEVIQGLLFYMYTGQVERLEWDLATGLYYAADKYQVQGLRGICMEFLLENITCANLANVLVLADMHQDKHLKGMLMDYICKNRSAVLNSYEWKEFEKQRPELALETQRNILLNSS